MVGTKQLWRVEYIWRRMQLSCQMVEADSKQEAKEVFAKHFPNLAKRVCCVEKYEGHNSLPVYK